MDTFEHRKVSQQVQVLHLDGSPAAYEKLSVDQVTSDFLFGAGGFDAVALMNNPSPEQKALLTKRLEKWLKMFNYATVPFYWGNYEPTEGQTMEPVLMKTAKYFTQKGVRVKGHPLCWHTVCAPWLMNFSNEDIMKRQLDRIHRETKAFKGLIDMWDVINEVVIMPVFDKYDNAVTRICKQYGRIPLVKNVFAAAKEENPDAVLLINDFNTSQAYEILIEGLLEAGVPISAIGIQSHQHQGYWGLEELDRVLKRYEHFGLPIHFTENTLTSGHLMPPEIEDLNDYQISEWPSTPEGEDRQARETAEMYSVLFSHPLVQAITTWDSVDGGWLGAPSGFIRADGTEKPVYDALYELIHGAWETHTSIVTDANGCVNLTGFKGEYEVKAGETKARFKLDDSEEKTVLSLK